MIFDIKKYKNFVKNDDTVSYVMHCRTKREASIFCKYLDSHGFKWCDGSSYMYDDGWETYKKETCYWFYDGSYCNIEYFNEPEYIILEFKDFDWNGNEICKFMTKKKQERCDEL